MVELRLPYPPSANRLWRRAGHVMHKSAHYVAWLQDAGWLAKAQKPKRIVGAYKLTIQARRPDKRRRDLDNLIKPTNDLLASIGVVSDDCHCEMICARWVTSGDAFTVRIEAAGMEAA